MALLTNFTINSAVMAFEEQRAYIKIRTLLGATPTDIKADLDTVYEVKLRHTSRLQDGSCDLSKMTPVQDVPCQRSVKMTSLPSNVC